MASVMASTLAPVWPTSRGVVVNLWMSGHLSTARSVSLSRDRFTHEAWPSCEQEVTMSAVTTETPGLPWGRPLVRADLDAMPDDGHRYELVDGVLLVSPAPQPLHQRVVLRLARLFDDACPDDCEVFVAPLDVVLADDTVLEPDIVVARRADLTERDLPAAPVLAVEVLSPSTRRFDLTLKRSRFEAAGTGSYWVVDPDEPSLIAWDLMGGRYVETARVAGDEAYAAQRPYDLVVTPQQLVTASRR
jgi:Uma2 family endonuclease